MAESSSSPIIKQLSPATPANAKVFCCQPNLEKIITFIAIPLLLGIAAFVCGMVIPVVYQNLGLMGTIVLGLSTMSLSLAVVGVISKLREKKNDCNKSRKELVEQCIRCFNEMTIDNEKMIEQIKAKLSSLLETPSQKKNPSQKKKKALSKEEEAQREAEEKAQREAAEIRRKNNELFSRLNEDIIQIVLAKSFNDKERGEAVSKIEKQLDSLKTIPQDAFPEHLIVDLFRLLTCSTSISCFATNTTYFKGPEGLLSGAPTEDEYFSWLEKSRCSESLIERLKNIPFVTHHFKKKPMDWALQHHLPFLVIDLNQEEKEKKEECDGVNSVPLGPLLESIWKTSTGTTKENLNVIFVFWRLCIFKGPQLREKLFDEFLSLALDSQTSSIWYPRICLLFRFADALFINSISDKILKKCESLQNTPYYKKACHLLKYLINAIEVGEIQRGKLLKDSKISEIYNKKF